MTRLLSMWPCRPVTSRRLCMHRLTIPLGLLQADVTSSSLLCMWLVLGMTFRRCVTLLTSRKVWICALVLWVSTGRLAGMGRLVRLVCRWVRVLSVRCLVMITFRGSLNLVQADSSPLTMFIPWCLCSVPLSLCLRPVWMLVWKCLRLFLWMLKSVKNVLLSVGSVDARMCTMWTEIPVACLVSELLWKLVGNDSLLSCLLLVEVLVSTVLNLGNSVLSLRTAFVCLTLALG